MKIHRIEIKNFRNFKHLEVEVDDHIVILGENKIGKSNLLYALRLVLDPGLPESARQLQMTDFWDGIVESLGNEDAITISVDLTDFEGDEDLMALLAEHIVNAEPMISRITYQFRPKTTLEQPPTNDSDYEFTIFGGDRSENRIGYDVRSRIPLEILPALRDAERDLANWNSSPLKPLLDHAQSNLDKKRLKDVSMQVLDTQKQVLKIPSVETAVEGIDQDRNRDENDEAEKIPPLEGLENRIVSQLHHMVGPDQALNTTLGFSATDPDRLLRSIRLFIDHGRRNVSDASLGSANLLYVTLKSLNLEQLVHQGLREHTFLAIEEPESHLHPHLQRLVYRNFLDTRPHQELDSSNLLPEIQQQPVHQSILLTTHSPHIASVTPVRSIVLLKNSSDGTHTHTVANSTVNLDLTDTDIADIERYLDINRGEILFAKGVVLVEGDAEEYLVPIFGQLLGYDFDQHGVSVCSVAGTNFAPYIKLLGPNGLNVPFSVITDADPQSDGNFLGHERVKTLLKLVMQEDEYTKLSGQEKLDIAPQYGIFLNSHTLEIDLFKNGGHVAICDTLLELSTNGAAKKRSQDWKKTPANLDIEQILKDLKPIGKGRFAQRLASRVRKDDCPKYISQAIKYVI